VCCRYNTTPDRPPGGRAYASDRRVAKKPEATRARVS
jgi:hypothetical protein